MLFSFSYWNWQCHLNEFIALHRNVDPKCKRWTRLTEVYELIDYHLSFLHSMRKDTPSIILRTSREFWFISISLSKENILFLCLFISHCPISNHCIPMSIMRILKLQFSSILFIWKRSRKKQVKSMRNFSIFSSKKLITAYVAPCWLFNFIVYQKIFVFSLSLHVFVANAIAHR